MTEDSSPSPGDHRVVKAYIFDRRQGESVDDWAESLRGLDEIRSSGSTCRMRPRTR